MGRRAGSHLSKAGPCSCFAVMKSCLQAPLSGLVRARYYFRARTGCHNLSEGTEEEEPNYGTKISGGVNVAVWFFVRKDTLQTKRNPPGSQRMCPCSTDNAWFSLLRLAVATASKTASLACLPKGLYGAFVKRLRSQDRTSFRAVGLSLNIPLRR